MKKKQAELNWMTHLELSELIYKCKNMHSIIIENIFKEIEKTKTCSF